MSRRQRPRRRRDNHGGDEGASFYVQALDAADHAEERAAELAAARKVEGLDEEVALLRVLIRDALEQHPDDVKLLHSGLRLLVQSLLAQHRLSPKQADNLGEAVANVLEEFGEALGTADDFALE